MKKPKITSIATAQELLFSAIAFVGLLGFCMLTGDVAPGVEMSVSDELTLRAVGAMAIAGTILSIRYLRERKILPAWQEMLTIQWLKYWGFIDDKMIEMSASLEEEDDKTT